MANLLNLQGGQPQKQTRFAPIYTGRWSSGLWTNRSPLRDANTTRLTEKYYGPNGDALIAGSNVEITNRLTLARRPGNPVFDNNSYSSVGRFEEFRLFGPSTEQINVMVDQANALYALYNNTRSLVWTKSTGAGQSYMQSVGNSLYFGNGADNKKWLQSLTSWSAAATWNGPTTPFLSTFFIDPNGNIQQLTATAIPVTTVQVAANVLTITSSQTLTNVLTNALQVTFPAGMAAAFLSGQTVTVTSVSGVTFTAAFTHANYGPTAETSKTAVVVQGGTPISAGSAPTWSTTVPSSGNNFQGGTTVDGTAQWTNRGIPVKNWGLAAGTTAPAPVPGSSRVAWQQNTYYSLPGVVIDSNGNVQQVFTAGVSGTVQPTWNTGLNGTTTDGTVTWKLIELAASLTWAAHTSYAAGTLLKGNASGTNDLFQLAPRTQPFITGNVNAYIWPSPHTGAVGAVTKVYPTSTGSASATATGNSLNFSNTAGVGPIKWNQLNGAGETTSTTTPFPGFPSDFQIAFLFSLDIPVAGQYTFSVTHQDGILFGVGGGATVVSGTALNDPFTGNTRTQTPVQGYTLAGGNNVSGTNTDTFTINFPTAGSYPVELDYDYWYHSGLALNVQCQGQNLVTGPFISGTTQPVWPVWSTSFAPNYPTITESVGGLVWNNLGPVTDYVWYAQVSFTLPNSTIIDTNGNTQGPYETGRTSTIQPTSWATGLGQLTTDNPNLIWVNQGQAAAPPVGTVTTFTGWFYWVALVDTLDDTVSNCSPSSTLIGPFIGATGVTLPAGTGLPAASLIDSQSDYVAIFRSTDGQAVPLLIPGKGNSEFTIPLSQYLNSGYTDTTDDTGLESLISGAVGGENTPPAAGAVNLTFHLNRIFFSIGNTVYWTSGPDTPVGNGVNGVAPLNFSEFPSLVRRIVPVALGALVFTVSDIYLISGQGTASSPIQSGQPYLQGIGLLSYNALDVNGSIIGFYTTDKQFLILDPSTGASYSAAPIGDQLRQNTGLPGSTWSAANVYVTWHVDGEDHAWYLADGQFGWYRLMPTPAPEMGYTWSPFATIVGGCKAVQSVEVSPGVHKLLVGPTATGPVLNRDLTVFQDNGASYAAYAVIGSAVLAQPGQIATVSFITTESVNRGTPLVLGVLIDEALPYFTGAIELLKVWEADPPGLTPSASILGQRFYLAEMDQAAACRHMQIQVNWSPENAQNELLSLTVFGAYQQEN